MKTNFTKLTIIGILVSILTLGLRPSLISAKAITGNINIDRSYVVPQPDKTLRFDAGFAAAYLGLPLKGHHTQEYIIGYMNGTASYESDRGEMFGYSNIPPTPVEKKNSNFMGGYGDGLLYRNDTRNTNSTIPSHTNDDYRNYFIGYHNGYEYMGDYIVKNGGTAPYICPSASQHGKDYCKGFIQGEAIEVWRSLMRELPPATQ